MTDYTKLTNFSVKDTLASGNPAKVIRGAEFDAEFNNIETAVNSKADEAELATEIQDRQAADQALQGSIDTETSSRISADSTLQGNIDAEEASRIAADTTLQSNIDAEASARQSADNILQGNIDAEASARQSADTTLQSNIDLKADIDNPVFTGNVGIGTTNPTGVFEASDQGSTFRLDADKESNDVNFNIRAANDLNPSITFTEEGVSNLWSIGARADDGSFVFKTQSSTLENGTERMRLTSDGKLLVNTITQVGSENLQVEGGIQSRIPSDGTYLRAGGSNNSRFLSFQAFSEGGIARGHLINAGDSGQAGTLAFGTGQTERMRLTSSGYLKADPSGSYQVGAHANRIASTTHVITGRAGDHSLVIQADNQSNSAAAALIEYTGNTQFILEARKNNSSTVTLRIDNSGNTVLPSDMNLKENITDSTPKLDDILAIRFVNYTWKEEHKVSDFKEFGVIAQELEDIFPSLVLSVPDTKEVETTDEEGNTVTETVETGTVTKSVKYSVLTLMAVKALQELKAEKDELAVEHESLKDQVRLLTERIEAIEAKN